MLTQKVYSKYGLKLIIRYLVNWYQFEKVDSTKNHIVVKKHDFYFVIFRQLKEDNLFRYMVLYNYEFFEKNYTKKSKSLLIAKHLNRKVKTCMKRQILKEI